MEQNDQKIAGFERIFNVVGWIGFLAIIPVALKVFGVPEAQAFLAERLGRYGSVGFLLIVFFALVVLRVIFGSGRIIAPLVIASLTGFLLIATAADVGIMSWLRNLVENSVFFGNMPLNFLTGVAVVLLGILMSYARRIPMLIQLIILVIFPVIFLVFCGTTGLFADLKNLTLRGQP